MQNAALICATSEYRGANPHEKSLILTSSTNLAQKEIEKMTHVAARSQKRAIEADETGRIPGHNGHPFALSIIQEQELSRMIHEKLKNQEVLSYDHVQVMVLKL